MEHYALVRTEVNGSEQSSCDATLIRGLRGQLLDTTQRESCTLAEVRLWSGLHIEAKEWRGFNGMS